MNFKTIRIVILLLILAYVGFDTVWSNQRATDWKRSLRVVIYPINADGSDASADYISQLEESNYAAINEFSFATLDIYPNPVVSEHFTISSPRYNTVTGNIW